MAILDVSDVLSDPFFCEEGPIPVIRCPQVIGDNGRATVTEVTGSFFGSIQPGDGDTLLMLPEAERALGSIVVYTTERLNIATEGAAADVVVWQGSRYMVRIVNDYSNYGAGYIEAICVLQAMVNGIDP